MPKNKPISHQVLLTELSYAIHEIRKMNFGNAETIIQQVIGRYKNYNMKPKVKDETK